MLDIHLDPDEPRRRSRPEDFDPTDVDGWNDPDWTDAFADQVEEEWNQIHESEGISK